MQQEKKPVQQHSSSTPSKGRAWSYSVLSAFELCPRKWAAENFFYPRKKLPQSDFQREGLDDHKAFEQYSNPEHPRDQLPLHLKHHEPAVDRLVKVIPHATIVVEQKLALTEDLQPTGWKAKDVWVRGIIDLMAYDSKCALIIDWKTGKRRPAFDQLDLMAAMAVAVVPTLEKISGMFYWTQDKKADRRDYPNAQLDAVATWEQFRPRVERFQEAVQREDFPARQNFLCKNFCPVTGCRYHGMSHK